MTAPDGFTFYAATDTAGMWCDRCPFDPVVADVQGSDLQELTDAALEHLKAKHADDPVTVEYVGATPYVEPKEGDAWLEGADGVVPWRSDVTYAGGGALIHTPTASFRTCAHQWTEHRTSPEGQRQVPIHHRCAMSATRQHDWHRCPCGGLEAAAPDPYQRSADA